MHELVRVPRLVHVQCVGFRVTDVDVWCDPGLDCASVSVPLPQQPGDPDRHAGNGAFLVTCVFKFVTVTVPLPVCSCELMSASSSLCIRVHRQVSHQLAEAVTDGGMTVAWYDYTNNGYEIGDICAGQLASVTLGDGKSYYVQKLWSDLANACTLS